MKTSKFQKTQNFRKFIKKELELKRNEQVKRRPSAIKSKPRSGGRVVKVFESLKKIRFSEVFQLVLIFR